MTLAAVRLNKFPWIPVVGVEIHAQVNSLSKLFSSAPNSNPSKSSLNSNFDLFDVSMPGSLPKLNEYCVKSAVKTSLALGLNVNKVSVFDRKHYFYADLPAGYQITQQRMPLASGGQMSYPVYTRNNRSQSALSEMSVRFDRLQLEHDSAKTVNVPSSNDQNEIVLIDMNRCGAPLMEIVTQPDFQFGYQVAAFVKEVMSILRSVNTCECKFHEGTIRVDTSVSVHRPDSFPPHCLHPQMTSQKVPYRDKQPKLQIDGVSEDGQDLRNLISFKCNVEELDSNCSPEVDSQQLLGGTIVEIKNINSIKFLTEAIDFEILRQIEIYEGASQYDKPALVENETRAYNSSAERKTVAMRDKTKVHDYRFLPETNLPPLVLKSTPSDQSGLPDVVISDIRNSIPQLPAGIRNQLAADFNLTSHSFGVLSEYQLFDLFNHLVKFSTPEVTILNANTMLSWVLNTLMVQARPALKRDFLFQIDAQLIHLSNLKDKNFIDSGHILRAVQLLQKMDDVSRDQLRDLSVFKHWLSDQRCVIKIPNDETKILFEEFCSQNLERLKLVSEEFENGANIDTVSLLSCIKYHKLSNKFGRKTKFQHDADFAFSLFLRKLNELKSS